MKFQKVFLLILIEIILLTQGKVAFVYEMIRHGARSPGNPDEGRFSIPPGELTASGMR